MVAAATVAVAMVAAAAVVAVAVAEAATVAIAKGLRELTSNLAPVPYSTTAPTPISIPPLPQSPPPPVFLPPARPSYN